MPKPQPLDLDKTVMPYLRAFAQAKGYGSVTVVFKEGVPVSLRPAPEIHDGREARRFWPTLSPAAGTP